MKVAVVGQQDFGKAVLEAFLARGDQVAAVFCAPEKEGARPDALRVAAQAKGLKLHQFKSLKAPEAAQAMTQTGADIGIMAFVLQFARSGARSSTTRRCCPNTVARPPSTGRFRAARKRPA